MEKISVIVPIFNMEEYLERCLNSLVNQTYKNLEIILVNDGSTDKSLEICEKFKKNDSRIKIVNKENGGLSDARNFGLREVSGEYISFIDSDDFIELDMFEYIIEEMNKRNCDIGICGIYIDYENGKNIIKKNDKMEILSSTEGIIKLNSFSSFDMAVWNKIYRKEVIDNIYFPKGKNSEDYFVMVKYFHKAKKIIVLPEAKYHYFQRNNSISRGKKLNYDFIEGSIAQKEYIYKYLPNLKYIADTAYAFSYIAVYNKSLEFETDIKKENVKKFKNEVRKNIVTILLNKNIKMLKKLQALCFCVNIKLYAIIFKRKILMERK